jgi:hypothetical protein
MIRSLRSLLPLVALVLFATAPAAAQKANDPVIGHWVYNAAKSKYADPTKAPKSGERMYEVVGGKLHSAGSTVQADGTTQKYEFTGAYDGKDAPYTGMAGDRISMTSIDERTVDATLKKGGKAVQKTRRAVSKDGKSLTMTTTLTAADGKTTTNISVYDRK